MSPAPPKANGSSRSSGRFKPGGVRPERTGTLTPTQMGVWARAQGSTCTRQSCRAGPGSAAALPTRPGATSSGGSAASEGGSHRGSPSHVPTARPALGSTAAEWGSGCFQSGCHARLQAPLPCSGAGREAEALSAHPRPQLPALGASSCWAPGTGPGPCPPTAPAQEAAPHPHACASGPGAPAYGPDGRPFWPQQDRLRLRLPPASEEAGPPPHALLQALLLGRAFCRLSPLPFLASGRGPPGPPHTQVLGLAEHVEATGRLHRGLRSATPPGSVDSTAWTPPETAHHAHGRSPQRPPTLARPQQPLHLLY